MSYMDEMADMMEEVGTLQDLLESHDFYNIDPKVEEVGRALGLEEIGLDKNKNLNVYFNVIIKYVAPICIFIILVTGLLDQFGVIVI